MSRKRWNLIPVLALFGSLAAACVRGGGRGPDVYLSPTGSDANDCLSAANACATPDRALGQVEDGGVVHFLPGEYHLAASISDLHGLTVLVFQGDSRDTTTLFTPAGGGEVLRVDAGLVGVNDLAFDGSDTPSGTLLGSRGLLLGEGAIVDVQRCLFSGLSRGIENNGAALTIDNGTFSSNVIGLLNSNPARVHTNIRSSHFAGNTYAIQAGPGWVSISGTTTFTGNGVNAPAGLEPATIQNAGHAGIPGSARMTIVDSTFEADAFSAITNLAEGTLSLRNVTISGSLGIGIENHGELSADGLTITRAAGSGFVNRSDPAAAAEADASLSRAEITGNGGAGIENERWLDLDSSLIQGNQGDGLVSGGRILSVDDSAIVQNGGAGVRLISGSAWINNSTISMNDGLGVDVDDGPFGLWFVTVAQNGGGGMASAIGGEVHVGVANSIIALNPGGVGDCSGQAGWTFEGFNLACDAPGSMAELGLDPLTAIGDTWVHPLIEGSPAVDSAVDLPPTRNCIDHDQTGTARPQPPGGRCDIGAYELIGSPSSLETTPIPFSTITPTPSSGPVFTFIQQANCRKGPNTLYESLGFGQVGEQVPIQGLSDPLGWYYVQLSTGTRCFAAGSTGDVIGSLDGLPVIPAPPLPVAPAAPGLSLSNKTCDATQYVVRLSWKDVEGETGYRVYRDGTLIATLAPNATVYDDTSPDYNAHDYRVEAYNDVGASGSATQTSEGCLY